MFKKKLILFRKSVFKENMFFYTYAISRIKRKDLGEMKRISIVTEEDYKYKQVPSRSVLSKIKKCKHNSLEFSETNMKFEIKSFVKYCRDCGLVLEDRVEHSENTQTLLNVKMNEYEIKENNEKIRQKKNEITKIEEKNKVLEEEVLKLNSKINS